MTTMAPSIRWRAPAARAASVPEPAPLVVAAAADALAVAVWLAAAPVAGPLAWTLAIVHGAAAALVLTLRGARPGRVALAATAVLSVPLLGFAIAAVVIGTRGRNLVAATRRRRKRPRARLTAAAVHRLASALPACDALACGDPDARRTALTALSRRSDSEAIALLRRAAAGRDPDLALSAALVLDEIGERVEREATDPEAMEPRHAVR
jgi:hypothetical protein